MNSALFLMLSRPRALVPLEVVLRADGTPVIFGVSLTAIPIIDIFLFFVTFSRKFFFLSINCLNIVVLIVLV